MNYHLSHTSPGTATSPAASVRKPAKGTTSKTAAEAETNGLAGDDPFSQLLNDVIFPLGQTIKKGLAQDAQDLMKLVKTGKVDDFLVLVVNLLDSLVDDFAQVADGIMHYMEDLITDLKELLEGDLDIPILKALYEAAATFSGGSPEAFSLINLFSFMISVPLVTVLQVGGHGSLADLNHGFDAPGFPAQLVSTIKNMKSSSLTQATSSAGGEKIVANGSIASKDLTAGAPSDIDYQALGIFSAVAGIIYSVSSGITDGLDMMIFAEAMTQKINVAGLAVRSIFGVPYPGSKQNWGTYTARWLGQLMSCGYTLITLVPRTKTIFKPVPGTGETMDQMIGLGAVVVNFICFAVALTVDAIEDAPALGWYADLISNTGGIVSNVGIFMGTEDSEGLGPLVRITGDLVGIGGCAFAAGGCIEALVDGKNWLGLNIGGSH